MNPPVMPVVVTAVGVGTAVPEAPPPSPSWPCVSDPQHQALPSDRSAQVLFWFAESATTSVRPGTSCGVGSLAPVTPMPSWPALLAPQQDTVSSRVSAQVCASPAATATTSAATSTGRVRRAVPPSPTWPSSLPPQQ
jgi:hypothetical protein